MSNSLTLPERHLANLLLRATARRTKEVLGPPAGEFGLFWHRATSDFERAFEVLWRLGVARGYDKTRGLIPYEPGVWCAEFQILFAEDVSEEELSSDTLDELLSAYLGMMTDYIEPRIPTSRGPFQVPESLRADLKALARCGYLDGDGDLFWWTDKIGPIMKAQYLWTSDGQCYGTIDETKIRERVDELWGLTSELVQRQLVKAAAETDYLEWMKLLRDNYGDLYFSRLPNGEKIPQNERDIRLIQEIRKFVQDLSPGQDH